MTWDAQPISVVSQKELPRLKEQLHLAVRFEWGPHNDCDLKELSWFMTRKSLAGVAYVGLLMKQDWHTIAYTSPPKKKMQHFYICYHLTKGQHSPHFSTSIEKSWGSSFCCLLNTRTVPGPCTWGMQGGLYKAYFLLLIFTILHQAVERTCLSHRPSKASMWTHHQAATYGICALNLPLDWTGHNTALAHFFGHIFWGLTTQLPYLLRPMLPLPSVPSSLHSSSISTSCISESLWVPPASL